MDSIMMRLRRNCELGKIFISPFEKGVRGISSKLKGLETKDEGQGEDMMFKVKPMKVH